MKCAGNHQTANCPKKSRTPDVRYTLFDANHPANYKVFAVYQSLRKARFPPRQKPINVQIVSNEFQPIPKSNQNTKSITIKNISYADMARQNNSDSDTQAEAPSTDIKGMMDAPRNSSLLVSLMPKATPVIAKP